MCGIVGIINFNQQSVVHNQIKAMTDSLIHRGPDGEGQYINNIIGLGHRRLSIIDLSSAGHQPMQTIDGQYTISYNGEVYNFKEIRTELEALGHRFYSQTDTEVILKSYVEWQEKCVLKFNGMFAFAIWNQKDCKLFLARDRFGVKPIYYYKNDKHFVFASEVKAIKSSGLYEKSFDLEGLVEYLTFQNFFTHRTLFQDVQILMPGHYAYVYLSGKLEICCYWDFDFSGNLKISETEAVQETDRLFNQAIKRQLISDVHINAYLSGGTDSGAITMVASKFLSNMKTFTIGFDLSSASGLEMSFDERAKAEHISYLAKTEHYEMVLKAGDMERCMDKYIYHLEEPRVGQSYPNYYAAKLASKFGKVVLSGCGGDEFFGGYPWRYFYTNQNIKFDQFVDKYYYKWQRLITNAGLKKLLSPIWKDVKHINTKDIFCNVFKSMKKKDLNTNDCLNASLYLEAKTFLHGLLVVEDKFSMAHSLETRVPFLDNDLVDFAMQVPIKYKITTQLEKINENDLFRKIYANKNGKYLLRKTLSKYLDKQVTGNKKQGFSSPDASWFRGESIDYVKTELSNVSNIFNQSIVNEIFLEHSSGKKNNRLIIWSLIYLNRILQT